MTEKHLILCGGTSEKTPAGVKVHRLQVGKDKNRGQIYLDTKALTAKMVQELPNVMQDLLEVATYVYVADQAISRGGQKSFDYGRRWHRCLKFKIPVREHSIWSDSETKALLEEALSFSSGDTYTFDFISRQSHDFSEYLNLSAEEEPGHGYNEVVLFSGGLDSFTGAVDEIVGNKRKPVLVGHQSNSKMVRLQRELHTYLTALPDSGPKPLHVAVTVNKEKRMTRETSQRTRSFLYAALGAIVAHIFRLNRVKFYENGVVSCNLSFDGQTLQARSTRSTHPKLLNLLSKLMSELFDSDFCFENPYLFKSKTQVCLRLLELHHEWCIRDTRSCAKSVYRKPHNHCGKCSQCIDRRFATLASECSKYDPDLLYEINIITDNLDNVYDRTMAAGFAGFATRIERMTEDDFVLKYSSEVQEIARHIQGVSCDEAMRAVFHLHQRHARRVNSVLDASITENKSSIRKGTLPTTCLLSMIARREHLNVDMLLRTRAEAGRKHAGGELEKKVDNLLDQDPCLSATEIALRVGNTSADAVRHTAAWRKKHRKQ